MRRVIKEAAVAAVAGLLLTAAMEAAEPNCLPWASAAPVIKKNSLLPGNVIYQMVQSRTGGQIIHASLCDQGGKFFYKLATLAGGASNFEVLVDDNGPGLTEAERERAVKRGQRLDETKPGSGLGLSIVAELAHLYKGRFELEPSPQGGLRARLQLPAA